MEEAFAPLFFPLCKRFVTQIADFIQISDFNESLGLADHSDSFNSVFTVSFAELFSGYVKDASLADVDCFI